MCAKLRDVINCTVLVSTDRLLGAADLRLPSRARRAELGTLRDALDRAEGQYLARLAQAYGDNLAEAARVAGLHRRTLERRYRRRCHPESTSNRQQ